VTIYVTHAHGDHYFGLKILLDRFPNTRTVATAPVVAAIRNQIKPDFVKSFWEPRFPGQLPSQLTAPGFSMEIPCASREALNVVELGHTDTSHVPSIGLVISGDCVSPAAGVRHGHPRYFLDGLPFMSNLDCLAGTAGGPLLVG